MSEGKWKHPIFEQLRNAEVEAPEFIMHEAIRRSSKKSFLLFRWNTFNLWYALIGSTAIMTFIVLNGTDNENHLVVKKASNVASNKQVQKVDVKESKSYEVTQKIGMSKGSGNNPRLKESSSVVGAEIVQENNTTSLKSKQDGSRDLEDAMGTEVDKVSSDSVSHGSLSVGGIDVNSQKVEKKIDLKKGRGLRVKLGGNSKP